MNITKNQNVTVYRLLRLGQDIRAICLIALVALALLITGCNDSSGSSSGAGETLTSEVQQEAGSGDSLQISPTSGMTEALAGSENVLPDILGDLGETIPLVFEPGIIDLGRMFPRDLITTKFSLRNTGTRPMTIKVIRPSCACTKLDNYSGLVIPPGESVELEARIKSRTVPSTFTSAISFLFEEYIGQATINISGEITRAIRTAPTTFNLVPGRSSGARAESGLIVIESIDNEPFNILSANGKEPIYQSFDPDFDEAQSSYVIEWDISSYNNSTRPGWWVIETDHPNCPVVDVRIRHSSTMPPPKGTRAWRVRTGHVVVDGIKPGESADFDVNMVNPYGDVIGAVRSLSKNFSARLISFSQIGEVPPDSTLTVRITPTSGYEGLLYGDIQFLSNKNQLQKIIVIGKAMEKTDEGQ